ncbi:MAG TPA: phenylalanine--tRNA ligase subunit alpha, partial [Armatimonadota bacterium]|nr:phenylalanine--tRNA ligase subunit alpha [Armatimonadota bacterium]
MAEISLEDIGKLAEEATEAIVGAATPQALDHVRVTYLGRQGKLTLLLRGIGQLPADLRPQAGKEANRSRQLIEAAIESRREQLAAEEGAGRGTDALDVTLPGRGPQVGHRHPLMTTLEHILDIFVGMGYTAVQGPEVEWCALNWTALNYPPDHPAMDEQDSFYITDQIMLRTQTSTAQIRAMRARH